MRFSAYDIYGNDFTSGHDPGKVVKPSVSKS